MIPITESIEVVPNMTNRSIFNLSGYGSIVLVLLITVLLLVWTDGYAANSRDYIGLKNKITKQVDVCHVSSSSLAKTKTISVGIRNAFKHLVKHDDTLGACCDTTGRCDDGVACTVDLCDDFSGNVCTHLPNDANCPSNSTCDVGQGCVHVPGAAPTVDCIVNEPFAENDARVDFHKIAITCSLTSTQLDVATADLRSAIQSKATAYVTNNYTDIAPDKTPVVSLLYTTVVAVEAWAGPGIRGNNKQNAFGTTCSAGSGGDSGYAGTLTFFGALANQYSYYLGDEGQRINNQNGGGGGASTLVLNNTIPFAIGTSRNPQDYEVLLIAGGGGGGGKAGTSDNNTNCQRGYNGGRGGYAQITTDRDSTRSGVNGDYSQSGLGGNQDGKGGGGEGRGSDTANSTGASGIGGIGSGNGGIGNCDNQPSAVWKGWPYSDADVWTTGGGGCGNDSGKAGGGGGGYGGGGGGHKANNHAGGGGGGGSWALMSAQSLGSFGPTQSSEFPILGSSSGDLMQVSLTVYFPGIVWQPTPADIDDCGECSGVAHGAQMQPLN